MSKTNNPLRGIVLSRYRSINEAAGHLNMSRWRLSSIVNGEISPKVDEVIDMAAACDVPISDIVAASRHMRELHSASQCDNGSYQPGDAEKKNDPSCATNTGRVQRISPDYLPK